MHLRKISLLLLALNWSPAQSSIFVEWPDVNTTTTASVHATLHDIEFDVEAIVSAGRFVDNQRIATDLTFLDQFPSPIPTLFYVATTGPSGSDISSVFSFSSPLPTGSRLLAMDFDGENEVMTLSSNGIPLTLLSQLESIAGESSLFPTYDSTTGELTEVAGSNSFEVSLFNISGLHSLTIDYQGGSFNGGSFVAIALPETASVALPETASVPEASAFVVWTILVSLCAGIGRCWVHPLPASLRLTGPSLMGRLSFKGPGRL